MTKGDEEAPLQVAPWANESDVAATLVSADREARYISGRIREASRRVDRTGREQALDPAIVVDTSKSTAAITAAEVARDGLRAVLPRLQTQLKRAQHQKT
jgi:hypothetical protein